MTNTQVEAESRRCSRPSALVEVIVLGFEVAQCLGADPFCRICPQSPDSSISSVQRDSCAYMEPQWGFKQVHVYPCRAHCRIKAMVSSLQAQGSERGKRAGVMGSRHLCKGRALGHTLGASSLGVFNTCYLV